MFRSIQVIMVGIVVWGVVFVGISLVVVCEVGVWLELCFFIGDFGVVGFFVGFVLVLVELQLVLMEVEGIFGGGEVDKGEGEGDEVGV